MQKDVINQWLESAAENGKMHINLFLFEEKISWLKENGLIVVKKYASKRENEFYCNVSWAGKRQASENEDFAYANKLHELAVKAKAV